ncbi:MAG: hypothetical protein WEC80_02480, partial [Patescibacteria group bacterium]
MNIPDNIFKAYDIRGVYPSEINEENLEIIITSIYSHLANSLKKDTLLIALGRDMRISSPALFEVAKTTLTRLGASIYDVGLVSTPTFYYSVLKYGYDAGIQISASHNPKEYTGLKIVKREGKNIIKIGKTTGMDEIKSNALNQSLTTHSSTGAVT